MSDQQAQGLTPAEREAFDAGMLTMDRDGRPATWSRLAYEVGWRKARDFYARSVVQVERPDERPAEDDDVALIAGIEDDDSLGPHQGMIDADEGSR